MLVTSIFTFFHILDSAIKYDKLFNDDKIYRYDDDTSSVVCIGTRNYRSRKGQSCDGTARANSMTSNIEGRLPDGAASSSGAGLKQTRRRLHATLWIVKMRSAHRKVAKADICKKM